MTREQAALNLANLILSVNEAGLALCEQYPEVAYLSAKELQAITSDIMQRCAANGVFCTRETVIPAYQDYLSGRPLRPRPGQTFDDFATSAPLEQVTEVLREYPTGEIPGSQTVEQPTAAQPQPTPGFTPMSEEAENYYFQQWSAPQIRDYMEKKYPQGAR